MLITELPEYQRLSLKEKHIITLRIMKVYGTHRHPERKAELRRVVDEIIKELKSGQRVH